MMSHLCFCLDVGEKCVQNIFDVEYTYYLSLVQEDEEYLNPSEHTIYMISLYVMYENLRRGILCCFSLLAC